MPKFIVKSVIIGIPEALSAKGDIIPDFEHEDEIEADTPYDAAENAYSLMQERFPGVRSATPGDLFYVDGKIFKMKDGGADEITESEAAEWRTKSYAYRLLKSFGINM